MICGQSTRSNGARLCPQGRRDNKRVETELVPPFGFIAATVDLAMVSTAERHRELVAHLAAKRSGLGKPQMMRVRRLPAADQAGLRSDELQMCFVAVAPRFTDWQDALIDAIPSTDAIVRNVAAIWCCAGNGVYCGCRGMTFFVLGVADHRHFRPECLFYEPR